MHNISEKLGDIKGYLSPRANRNSVWSVIGRLLFGSTVYHVWQERNMRLYNKESRSVACVVSMIFKEVRLKLLSLFFKNSCNSMTALKLWRMESNFIKT